MKLLAAIVIALSCTATFADDAADVKAMTATWTPEKFEVEGADMTATFKDIKLVIDGVKYTVTINGLTDSGTVKLDSNKTPKAMDVIGTEGVNKGKTYPCIYELKDGKLTVCYSTDEKVRPTKFETSKDSKTMLAVYSKK